MGNGEVRPVASTASSKRNEIALAKVSLTIVLIFILCHSVKWIPNIYELARLSSNDKRQWPTWIESTTHVAHFLMSFNSSVNFYVYCVKHFKCKIFHRGGHSGAEPRGQIMLSTASYLNPTCSRNTMLVVDRPKDLTSLTKATTDESSNFV